MKRIPITRSLWHPMSRTMSDGYIGNVHHIVVGIKIVAYCCRGTLTVIGLGQYSPS